MAQPVRAEPRVTRGLAAASWLAPAISAALVLAVVAWVLALRVANRGAEPEHANWWLVAELVLALVYVPSGTLLIDRGRRLLGSLFVVVGVSALTDALATQYLGYAVAEHQGARWPAFAAASSWAWVLGAGVLTTLLLLALAPSTLHRRVRPAMGLAAAGIALQLLPPLTHAWPAGLGANPLVIRSSATHRAIAAAGDVGTVIVGLVATLAVGLLAAWWWSRRTASDDPLPGWLLAGGVVAWLAVVPPTVAVIGRHVPARDVVQPILLLATAPLLAGGALIELLRGVPSGFDRLSHRFLEWVLLAAGIMVIYTGLVAGLGRLVGGSGPTWFLVAATGVIAVLVEPGRRRVRSLVDRLAYGSRDDPLALVRQVMDHVERGRGRRRAPAVARRQPGPRAARRRRRHRRRRARRVGAGCGLRLCGQSLSPPTARAPRRGRRSADGGLGRRTLPPAA